MIIGKNPSTLRQSLWAVFAGILANILIATVLDIVLHMMEVFPPISVPLTDSLCALAFSYRLLAALVGGYLTARLAPNHPMKHALILGTIGVVMSSAGTVAMWNIGPNWYPLLLIVISIPCSWAGAKIFEWRS